jgi:DNA (cytosine-5)-methyltransferase 1
MRELTFVDLFCGCGGFSLGFDRAGFRCLAAIDSDPKAIATFSANFPSVRHVIQRDLLQFAPSEVQLYAKITKRILATEIPEEYRS